MCIEYSIVVNKILDDDPEFFYILANVLSSCSIYCQEEVLRSPPTIVHMSILHLVQLLFASYVP